MTDELMHHGVKGMKWGVRRTPEQLGHRVERLQKKNESLEKSIVKSNAKAARYKVRGERKLRKYMKLEGGILGPVLPFGKSRMRRSKFKATRMFLKSAKFEQKARKAEARIHKNEALMKAMNTRISEMNSATVQAGAAYLDSLK